MPSIQKTLEGDRRETREKEAATYRQYVTSSLEERNLTDWENKLEELRTEAEAIAQKERGGVAHALWGLVDSIPTAEKRRELIGKHVDEAVDDEHPVHLGL